MGVRVTPSSRPLPGYFWFVALAGLGFELLGCLAYILEVTTDVATLPLDERSLREATPSWITAAYAVAVWGGLCGAVGLLLRRRWSSVTLLVSLVAVVVQFGSIIAVPSLRAMVSSDELLGPVLIFLCAYGLWQFSLTARNWGWLR